MKKKFNPNTLKPGEKLNTLAGPATFELYREGNFRNQCFKVKLTHNGDTRWYTAEQLKEANREVEPQTI